MKSLLEYFKSAVFGGVIFVLPFFFNIFILTEGIDILLGVTTPNAEIGTLQIPK
jgi:hypothetical protein